MDIKRIVDEIKKGNLVIAPSDTVYGILAKSTDDNIINKVFEAKKRAKNKSLIVLVNSLEMLKTLVCDINYVQQELINKYWPGKLTIVFDKKSTVSNLLTGGRSTIAVRYPNNKNMLDIISQVNEPLISTSANISNNDTIISVDMLDDELKKYISYISNGGKIDASSSTIVCVIGDSVKILRDGDLSEDIKKNFKIID